MPAENTMPAGETSGPLNRRLKTTKITKNTKFFRNCSSCSFVLSSSWSSCFGLRGLRASVFRRLTDSVDHRHLDGLPRCRQLESQLLLQRRGKRNEVWIGVAGTQICL